MEIIIGIAMIVGFFCIWHHVERCRRALDIHTATLRELLAEVRRHSNQKVACPKCSADIRLADGCGMCARCGQEVHA
jgi:DNA polymerase II large subunit